MSTEKATKRVPPPPLLVDDELKALRAELDRLNVRYHHRNNHATLRALIAEAREKASETVQKPINRSTPDDPIPTPDQALETAYTPPQDTSKLALTEVDYKEREFQDRKRKMGSLVRVRVQCMNPNKKAWPGEIISVGSSRLGTFKKYVPFGSDQPYHVPYIIYQELRDRKCRVTVERTLSDGKKISEGKLIPEFVVERLPDLTHQELKDLADQQARAGGV